MWCELPNVNFKDCKILRLGAQAGEEAGKDPLGHSPDDGIIELVGFDLTDLAGDLEAHRMVSAGSKKTFEGYPAGGGDLWAEGEWKALVEDKYERTDGNGGKHRGSGDYLVQSSRHSLALQANAHFFGRLPDGGCR